MLGDCQTTRTDAATKEQQKILFSILRIQKLDR